MSEETETLEEKFNKETFETLLKEEGLCAVCQNFEGSSVSEGVIKVEKPLRDYSCREGMLVLDKKSSCVEYKPYEP